MSPQQYIALEEQFGAHNYHPLPVVLSGGSGALVWDVEGKSYLDFLSGYSAINQGHCHPRIISALTQQASKLTLTSRAFYNDKLGEYEQYITQLLGYDKLLPMNSGAEAVETAIKLARRWGYEHKKVEPNQAKIIVCEGNFHGRTSTIISFSSDPSSYHGFGPYMTGFKAIPYNDVDALKSSLSDPNVVGFLFEPIQGEAGIIVPDEGYLKQARTLCSEHHVLMMADEIQSGLGRTGKFMACDHEAVRPDLLILGKALSGGIFPISGVLANDEVMLCIRPGEHGSTFGGSPLSCVVAMESLKVLTEEKMAENAEAMGLLFRKGLERIGSPLIREIRGKGLMNAIEIEHPDSDAAWKICEGFMGSGLLAKPTHGDKIRLTPPLLINEEQINHSLDIISSVLTTFKP